MACGVALDEVRMLFHVEVIGVFPVLFEQIVVILMVGVLVSSMGAGGWCGVSVVSSWLSDVELSCVTAMIACCVAACSCGVISLIL